MAKSRKSDKKVSILKKPFAFAIIVGVITSAITSIISIFVPKKK